MDTYERQMPHDAENILTPTDLSRYLRIKRAAVLRAQRQGTLPDWIEVVRLGPRTIRFRLRDDDLAHDTRGDRDGTGPSTEIPLLALPNENQRQNLAALDGADEPETRRQRSSPAAGNRREAEKAARQVLDVIGCDSEGG